MLNKQKGNMYGFVTHTWNTVKGKCLHDCSYCYMKRWGNLKEVRLDEKELNTDLGEGNFIFVGSSCDMFAENIPKDWIYKTLLHCHRYNNKYLFQTKNPKKLSNIAEYSLFNNNIVCFTLESNIDYKNIMNKSPKILDRFTAICGLDYKNTMITIEPILDFVFKDFVDMIRIINPFQVNIGADSQKNNLPEPPKEKVLELIMELEKFTKVYKKDNLKRLLK